MSILVQIQQEIQADTLEKLRFLAYERESAPYNYPDEYVRWLDNLIEDLRSRLGIGGN